VRPSPILSVLLVLGTAACSRKASPTEYRLYLLAGQSNMEGYGNVAELPVTARGLQPGVMIFHGNSSDDPEVADGRGRWVALRPGHGAGFTSDGDENRYSERFGPELAFASELRRLDPTANIAIVKYARGGTSLARLDLEPGWARSSVLTQLDHTIAAIERARSVRDIDHDGAPDTLVAAGIVWMQGESDANQTEAIARAYGTNLRATMTQLRKTLGRDDLPLVIGRISDSRRDSARGRVWKFGDLVRHAQEAFVASDPNAALVDTDHYGYSDALHYDTAGYLDLGAQFARAMAAAAN